MSLTSAVNNVCGTCGGWISVGEPVRCEGGPALHMACPEFEIVTQDAFCFSGCLPDGTGPESNGDRFRTRDEAVEEASRCLRAMLEDARCPAMVIDNLIQELRTTGEASTSLPYTDEDAPDRDETGKFTSKVATNGTRFVSVAVNEIHNMENS